MSVYKELKKLPNLEILEAALSRYDEVHYNNSCNAIYRGVFNEVKGEKYGLSTAQCHRLAEFYRKQYHMYANEVGKPKWWNYSDGSDDVKPEKIKFIKEFIEFSVKRGKWLPITRD